MKQRYYRGLCKSSADVACYFFEQINLGGPINQLVRWTGSPVSHYYACRSVIKAFKNVTNSQYVGVILPHFNF